MKRYCFGASKFYQNFIKKELIQIDGIFDNDVLKWGQMLDGVYIEKPCYKEKICIYITVGEKLQLEIVHQLLELGYRKFYLVQKKVNGQYRILELDYTNKDFKFDKEHLVLLFLESNSYAGIRAIDSLYRSFTINTYDFVCKIFKEDSADRERLYDLATAKYFITERNGGYQYHNIYATMIQMWHGFPLKAMERMASNYNCNSESYLRIDWDRYKYIVSYGQNYTTMISACFGTRENQFVVTGMPRNDLLFYTDGRMNLEKILPECVDKKIVLYMPTFREIAGNKNGDENGYIFYWDDFKLEKFKNFCWENNIYFIFKLHPSDESKVRNWCEQSDCIGILNDELLGEQCAYEFLNGVDILITDYSSVYYDYMLLDRPIIFTNRDEEEYIANRGFIVEPSDFWRPGPIVNTMDDLQREIENVLHGEDSHKEHRKQLMPFVHKYTDGNSTQRLFDLLKEDLEKTNE